MPFLSVPRSRPYGAVLLALALLASVAVAIAARAPEPAPIAAPPRESLRPVSSTTGPLLDDQSRAALLDARQRAIAAGASNELADVHAALARDALARVSTLTVHWLDHRDPVTGLLPTRLRPDGQIWTYQDTASDLYPFLAIATKLLQPDRYGEILAVLDAERARSPGFPVDSPFGSDPVVNPDEEKRFLGATEYAKDGLLPLMDRLGPDPWLGRLTQIADRVLEAADTPTPEGPIVASSTELNGNTLQMLARLYWATRDPRYYEMGRRIAAVYLDYQLPITEHVPSHRWDFMANEPIGPRRFYLGDHGDEIVSGLVEWHRIESELNRPVAAQHRLAVRRLLDRLLTRGRTPDGLWFEMIDVPGGRVRDADLTDNWGYLAQAYLHQAQIERGLPNGDLTVALTYEQEVSRALEAVARTGAYPWEAGQMDGVADTVESALYVLRWLQSPAADSWVHQEAGVLMRFQQPDGRVTDENIDGNFIRTVMLYAEWLSQGVRLDPWSPDVGLGAVRDGDCLLVHLEAVAPWSGRAVFDSERHRANLDLPTDYPRLNQWMQWFTVSPGARYELTGEGVAPLRLNGVELLAGQPVTLTADQAVSWRVCPLTPTSAGR